MADNIIFIKENIILTDSVGISQSLYRTKLITIIGEKHDQTIDCVGENTIDIQEYCNRCISVNENCYIFLEYNNRMNPSYVKSNGVKNTYDQLKEYSDRIIPVDIRSDFIDQKCLYNKTLFNKLSEQEKYTKFIEPFYTNIDKLHKVIGEEFYDKINKFITENYQNTNKNYQFYKDIWSNVMDYYILKLILFLDKPTEIIIIIGDRHRKNLMELFKRYGITELFNYDKKCANLFSSYKIFY